MWISTSLLLPVLVTALIPLTCMLAPPARDNMRRRVAVLAPVAVLPAVFMTIAAPGSQLSVDWVLYGLTMAVDDISRSLVLISVLLYGGALISIVWTRPERAETHAATLAAFLLVSYAGNIGVYLAADAVSFYLCFAIMSFSAVGLVVHYRTAKAYRATRIYLVMTVISETALLAGLFLTVHAGGMLLVDAPQAVVESPYIGLILTLLLIGFGIKFGTVPLHVWLPLAHPAAPPAASAVLSGAMVKAGMVGYLRFFPMQDPVAEFHTTVELFGCILLVLSLLGAFAAVIVGVLQHDAKVVLAYSTISQMGFIGALIAAGLIDVNLAQDTIDAAVLYAVHHGLAKGALFLGVPVIKCYGRGAAGVIVTVGMCGAGLAVAGAPVTSGGLGKYVSKDAVGGLTIAGMGLEYFLAFVATGSTLLLLRFAWVVLTDKRQTHSTIDGDLLGWLGVCAAGIVVPWFIGAYWSPLGLPQWVDVKTLWDASWPIGLGALIGGAFWWAAHVNWLPERQRDEAVVLAGDLVRVEERAAYRLVHHGGTVLDTAHKYSTAVRTSIRSTVSAVAEHLRGVITRLEHALRPWPRFGTTVVLVLTIILVLSLMSAGGDS